MSRFLPGRRKKSPAELVKSTQNHIKILSEKKDEAKHKKSSEKISANLATMKFMLYGDGDNEPKAENIKKLTDELFKSDLLLEFLQHLKRFDFEARKDVAQVYNFVLRQRKTTSLQYLKDHSEILHILVNGYGDVDIALNCGSILREVLRHKELNEMLLKSKLFDKFFTYVQLSTFDVASDAFLSFKLMLTKHKTLSASFLESNYDQVFTQFNKLLESKNYVTKRQSLKLLAELLLNRANFNVMMRYINDASNLKNMMNLLSGTTKAIQFEAFHVFKIFVANPKKNRGVIEILIRNRVKLIEFLRKFKKDTDDEQFNDEKGILLATLETLEAPAPTQTVEAEPEAASHSEDVTVVSQESEGAPSSADASAADTPDIPGEQYALPTAESPKPLAATGSG